MVKLAVALVILSAAPAFAPAFARGGGGHSSGSYSGTGSNTSSHATSGYTTGRGTYVAPHRQTNPTATMRDNYSARGNVNPSTGRMGTRLVPH